MGQTNFVASSSSSGTFVNNCWGAFWWASLWTLTAVVLGLLLAGLSWWKIAQLRKSIKLATGNVEQVKNSGHLTTNLRLDGYILIFTGLFVVLDSAALLTLPQANLAWKIVVMTSAIILSALSTIKYYRTYPKKNESHPEA